MSFWNLLLSFCAGALTILSPCVLPLVPVVVVGAQVQDARAPFALAFGLAATFGTVGGFVASLGVDFGESPYLREIAAIAILAIGVILFLPACGERFALAVAPLQRLGTRLQNRLPQSGLAAQIAAGALLALIWAPCAGPTLAAAVALAARSGKLSIAMLSMGLYTLGAAGALLAIGFGFGQIAGLRRVAALRAGAAARSLLGGAFSLVGLLVLTGADHWLEAVAIAGMPDWLARAASGL